MIYFSLNIILLGHRTTGIEFIAIIIAVILVFIQAAIKGEKRVKEDKEYCRKKGIDYNEFLSFLKGKEYNYVTNTEKVFKDLKKTIEDVFDITISKHSLYFYGTKNTTNPKQ